MTKVKCTKCGQMTDFSRFICVTAGQNGVFQSIFCVHCSARLVVQTLDAILRRLNPPKVM